MEELGLVSGGYSLATVHLAENTDDIAKLRSIVEALVSIGDVHLRTEKCLLDGCLWEGALRKVQGHKAYWLPGYAPAGEVRGLFSPTRGSAKGGQLC